MSHIDELMKQLKEEIAICELLLKVIQLPNQIFQMPRKEIYSTLRERYTKIGVLSSALKEEIADGSCFQWENAAKGFVDLRLKDLHKILE